MSDGQMLLNVGNPWDIDLLDHIIQWNQKHDMVRVNEMYGTTLDLNVFGNARTPSRLQGVSKTTVSEIIRNGIAEGISFSLCMNASCVGDPEEFVKRWTALGKQYLDAVCHLGFSSIIIAHPLVLEMVVDTSYKMGINGLINLHWSTIPNTFQIPQILHFADEYGITKATVPLWRNRDFVWLNMANQVLHNARKAHSEDLANPDYKRPVELELLANEFCHLGFGDCEGVFRQSCYQMSSHGGKTNSVYPQSICTKLRMKDPTAWIKAKFILPQWMRRYALKTGISRFKITGRTHPAMFLKRILPYYYREFFSGNLLELWAHLETIEKSDFDSAQRDVLSKVNLPVIIENNQKWNDFLDHFIQISPSCDVDCGINCHYCDGVYLRMRGL